MLRRSYTEIKITLNEEVSVTNHRRSLTTSFPPPKIPHTPLPSMIIFAASAGDAKVASTNIATSMAGLYLFKGDNFQPFFYVS